MAESACCEEAVELFGADANQIEDKVEFADMFSCTCLRTT